MKEERMAGNALGYLAARLRNDLGDMTLLKGKLGLPKTRKAGEEREKALACAERGRFRMLRMARNMEVCGALLLDPEFEREPCDLVALMVELCEGASDLAKMMDIHLTLSCAEDKHICAVNAEYVRLCVENLLSNAFKSEPRGGHVRMMFRNLRDERAALLAVEDSGRGIDPERLPTLFDGFWTETPGPRSITSRGLGLPLCKRVAEGHGGTLTVESTPGKGSTFTVRIPSAPAIMGPGLRQDEFFVPYGGLNPMMVMLSDALPWTAFTPENLL